MSDLPSRKRRIAVVALAFVTGALVGGFATSAAASRASRVFLTGARGRFIFNQEQKLAAAWDGRDMNKALAHATCAFEAGFGDGARNFDASYVGWNVWGGALTHLLIVEPNAEAFRRARPTEEAIARARVAVVLERLGLAAEAQHQLDEAVRASGIPDAARWRDIGLKTISLGAPGTGEHR